jgi:hypothetical protein
VCLAGGSPERDERSRRICGGVLIALASVIGVYAEDRQFVRFERYQSGGNRRCGEYVKLLAVIRMTRACGR